MDNQKKAAFQVVLLFGLISLCGDVIYEGARSVSGPYLLFLGASAGAVGLVSGLGEFLGYGLRLFFGYLADRTKTYWLLTCLGYGLILVIPFLAFAGHWQVAAGLLILERIGKAVRTPARDTILSNATKTIGRGLGFGIHEALDQIGAILGPFFITVGWLLKKDYRFGFHLLWLPGIFLILSLFLTRQALPGTEPLRRKETGNFGLSRLFFIYVFFVFFSSSGFINFQLISFHFQNKTIFSPGFIPVMYLIAMAIDGLTAPIIGKIYDWFGLAVLILIPIGSLVLPWLVFSATPVCAIFGVIIWGVVMACHETIMRAAVADMTGISKRGLAYGILNTVYGLGSLVAGTAVGLLYQCSLVSIQIFVMGAEVVGLAIFVYAVRNFRERKELSGQQTGGN